MKKKLVFFAFLPLLALIFLFACNKNDDLPIDTTTTKEKPKQESNGDVSVTSRSSIDTSDCSFQLSQVTKSNGMLVFQDWEHFEKCAVCLENYYEFHNNAFDSLYLSSTAEQLDSIASLTNFNEWHTYEQFESNLNFSSLRAKVLNDSEDFLNGESADSIDLEEDPDALCPVFRTSERALLNENGEVLVDDTLRTKDEDWAAKILGDCAALKFKNETFTVDANRKLKVWIGVKSHPYYSVLWGKMKYYKRGPDNKFHSNVRADMRIRIDGKGFTINCEETTNRLWYKYKGYKYRTNLEVTDIMVGYLQAFVDSGDPLWLTTHCLTRAYLFNDNFYYPYALED